MFFRKGKARGWFQTNLWRAIRKTGGAFTPRGTKLHFCPNSMVFQERRILTEIPWHLTHSLW